MKTGMAPIGSTTKKIAERDSRLKLSHSLIMRSAAGCSPSAVCTILCFPARLTVATIIPVEEATYRELVENASDIIYAHDLEGRFIWVNRACERMTGYTRDEILRMRIWDLVAPEYRAAMEKDLSAEMQTFEVELVAKDGRRIPMELKSRLVHRGQMPVAVQGIARDVTERRRAAEAMRESEERYALAALGSNDGLWDWDLRGNRVFFSARWKEQLGAKDDEIGDDPRRVVRPGASRRPRAAVQRARPAPGGPHPARGGRAPGAPLRRQLALDAGARRGGARRATGKAYRVAGSQTDITARKLAEEKLHHDALHDGAHRAAEPLAVHGPARAGARVPAPPRRTTASRCCFLDLDRFKTVNESLGHTEGDGCWCRSRAACARCARPGDTVARLGGDEFALLLEDFSDAERAALHRRARRRRRSPRPYDLGRHRGVRHRLHRRRLGTRGYSQPEELLRDADTAMYRAKEQGAAGTRSSTPRCTRTRGRGSSWTPTCGAPSSARSCGCATSRWSRCRPGEIVGCEALIFWEHPTRGEIPPGDFIPAAEETGLIVPIGRWAMTQACLDARAWNDALGAGPGISVSVNLSARQLLRPSCSTTCAAPCPQRPRRAPAQAGGDRERDHGARRAAALLLTQLKALSVGLSLDDFGTGYSSLSYLHNFRFDTLKIDRSFVARLETSAKEVEIVRTIVSLARALQMEVVAEGVENAAQAQQLRDLQVDSAQGYWFSRALGAKAFLELLLARKTYPLRAAQPETLH